MILATGVTIANTFHTAQPHGELKPSGQVVQGNQRSNSNSRNLCYAVTNAMNVSGQNPEFQSIPGQDFNQSE